MKSICATTITPRFGIVDPLIRSLGMTLDGETHQQITSRVICRSGAVLGAVPQADGSFTGAIPATRSRIATDFSGGMVRGNPEVNKRIAEMSAPGRAGLPDALVQ